MSKHLFAHESEIGLDSIKQLILAPQAEGDTGKLKPVSPEGSLLTCMVADAVFQ